MAVRIQIRNGTASEWQSVNPILAIGELAIEIDTRKFKIGNGNQAWNSLPYATMGDTGKSLEYNWDGTKLGIRVEGETQYSYVDVRGAQGPEGDKGDTGEQGIQGLPGLNGKSLEFHWNGTQLGIRIEGETTYQYVNLKGEKGDQGIQGEKGIQGPKGEQGIQGIQGPDGKSIEHVWQGTELGLRLEGQSTYQFVDLEGPEGPQGPKGDSAASVEIAGYYTFSVADGDLYITYPDGGEVPNYMIDANGDLILTI